MAEVRRLSGRCLADKRVDPEETGPLGRWNNR